MPSNLTPDRPDRSATPSSARDRGTRRSAFGHLSGWILGFAGLATLVTSEPAFAGDGEIVDGKLNLSVLYTYREDDVDSWRPMFEEANRLLYNATNGQLQLGRIQVHNCGWDRPDIDVWVLDGNSGAFANLLGLGEEGHLYLSQTHKSTAGGALGQFGFVHELGHYVFGVLDEYKGESFPSELAARDGGDGLDSGEQSGHFHAPNQFCTTDDDPVGCLMDGGSTVAPNNGRTEFCTHATGELRTAHNTGTVVGQEIFINYQELLNGESCWETMARTIGLEAPDDVDTNLPDGLEPIEWEVLNDLNYLVLTADRSASMFTPGRPIQLAQDAASRIIDLLHAEATVVDDDGNLNQIPGEFLSIVGFGPEADVLFPMQEILDDDTKAEAKSFIENLPPNQLDLEETSIHDALSLALEEIESQGSVPACNESIILLSDGRDTSDDDLTGLLGEIAGRGIEVYSVGLGEDSEVEILDLISEETGGQFFRATAAEDLPDIFTAIAAAVRADGILVSRSDSTSGEGESLPLLVDSLAEDVTVISTWEGGPLNVELITSMGERITVDDAASRDDVESGSGPGFSFIRVLEPDPGEWIAEILPGDPEDVIDYEITVLGGDRGIVLEAHAAKTFYDAFPGPLKISADVLADVPVAGALVSGVVTRPDGSLVPVEFFDDGAPGNDDDWGDDGRYTAIFGNWNGDGVYEFFVEAVNIDGTGPDPDLPFVEDGADPPLAIPPFRRETTLNVTLDTGIWTVEGRLGLAGGFELDGDGSTFSTTLEFDDPGLLEDIDMNSLRLGRLSPTSTSAVIGDSNENGVPDLSIPFETAALASLRGFGMETPIALTGRFENGHKLEASTTIQVVEPQSETDVALPGDRFVAGDRIDIVWPAAAVEPVRYDGYVSYDNGRTWELAFADVDENSFEWAVPAEAGTARILIETRSPERVVEQHQSPGFEILLPTTEVDDFELAPGAVTVHPLPVKGRAVLRFAIPQSGEVSLDIFDVSGRKVRNLVSANQTAGTHTVKWNGEDDLGRPLRSGVYLYVLRGPGVKTEGRITVVR